MVQMILIKTLLSQLSTRNNRLNTGTLNFDNSFFVPFMSKRVMVLLLRMLAH